jgi:hypothetical protein
MPATTAAQAPGAAGQRLARAAFVHAQADLAAVHHLHEAGVHAAGKRGWFSISGPVLQHRRGVDVARPVLHRMRVAHGQHRHVNDGESACACPAPAAISPSRPRRCGLRPAASNGTAPGSNTGAPMSTVTRPSACSAARSRRTASAPGCPCRQALVAHVAHEAARAVAALLHLAAVGVVDHVFEVDAFAGEGRTDRIWSAPTPKWRSARKRYCAVGQARARGFVEHDEVVARALHLGESDAHNPPRCDPLPPCCCCATANKA